MHWTTASSLDRVAECVASTILPQTESSSSHGDKGRDVHSEIEEDILNGRTEKYGVGAGVIPEIGIAFDVSSGAARELGRVANRRYPVADSPSTVYGTADAVWDSRISIVDKEYECVDIVDWKTGFEPPPPTCWQMKFLALAFATARKKPYARTRITQVRDGEIRHSNWAVWGPSELNQIESQLHAKYQQHLAKKAHPVTVSDVKPGPHCHFCPAYVSCPYTHALMKSDERSLPVNIVTNFDAVTAYERWQNLRSLSGRLEAAVKHYSSVRPIELPSGKLYGKRTPDSNFGRFSKYDGQ